MAKPLVVYHNRLKPHFPRNADENDNGWVFEHSRTFQASLGKETSVQTPDWALPLSQTGVAMDADKVDHTPPDQDVYSARKAVKVTRPNQKQVLEIVRRRPGRPRRTTPVLMSTLGVQTDNVCTSELGDQPA